MEEQGSLKLVRQALCFSVSSVVIPCFDHRVA